MNEKVPSWTALEEVRALCGDSFYLCSVASYEANVRRFTAALAAVYSNARLAHSYKTNYLPALCRRADQLGVYAEVVSPLEYQMALRFGVAPDRVIFQGPVKTESDLADALGRGSTVNVDSPQEADWVGAYAQHRPETELGIGLRVSFDIGSGQSSRFGLDAESKEFPGAVEALKSCPNVRIRGLHCHFSAAREASYFTKRSEGLLRIADEFLSEGPPLDYFDVGGGFCGVMPDSLKKQLPYEVPSFEEYAEACARPFAERFPATDPAPELIVEPGMGLLSNVLQFVCRIHAVKRTDGRPLAICAGSILNTQPLSWGAELPVATVRAPGSRTPSATVTALTGNTCMEVDLLNAGLAESVEPGDYAVFSNVGAYTTVLNPPFITPPPAIVSLENRVPTILRRPQTCDDILAPYPL